MPSQSSTIQCRVCFQPFEPTASQIRWYDRRCTGCRAVSFKERSSRPGVKEAVADRRRKSMEDPTYRRKVAKWQAEYHSRPEVRAKNAAPEARAKKAAYQSLPEVKERNAERQRELARSPEGRKQKAVHSVVRRAVASGKLVRQPCESCGKSPAEAHHNSYDKPLAIRWLCRNCHARHHAALSVTDR